MLKSGFQQVNFKTIGLCALIAAPIVLLISLINRYGVDVIFWDQWEFAGLLQKGTAGTLTFSDFWAQHNEHRILLPRLIMFFWAKLTHWNTLVELYTSVAIAVASFYLLVHMIFKTFHQQGNLAWAVAVVVSWLFFSPTQWENWLWGWQIQWFLSIFGVFLCISYLHIVQSSSMQWKKLFIAALGATIATYSLGNGLAAWGVGAIILWLLKSPIKKMAVWLLAGLLVTGVHYIGYVNVPYPSKTLFLHQPVIFFEYILVYVGRPLTNSIHQSAYVGLFLLGLFGLALFYFWYNRKSIDMQKIAPWIGLGVYGLAGAILTAISRMGFGLNSSFSSRYITVSLLFTLAVFVLCLMVLVDVSKKHPKSPYPQFAQILIISGVMFATIINYPAGIEQMHLRNLYLSKIRTCLVNATTVNDPCLILAYPDSEKLWPILEYVRKEKLSNFRD